VAGDFAIGAEVAGYRIEELIARGGMGVVYRATHLGLDRPVALKVIARELADRPGFRERFLRESRLAARLEHPAVVPVYDSREVDAELIVAMKLVKGGDLRRLIDREGPLSPERAIALLAQVADALDAAHAAGIVHRDVKPHNILVEGDRAYLSDFGLAKALDESATGSGSVVGTAQYMSPEQWRGEEIGPAADVYSLGCVLYEALTGIPPFRRGEEDTEPELPQGVDEAIRRAVAKEPGERYATAGALIAAARAAEGSEVRPTAVLSHDPSERTTVPNRSRGFFGLAGGRSAVWLFGGAAIFVAAMVAAVLFLLLGDDEPQVSAPIAVGTPPLRLDAGPKAVWVTSEKDGTLIRLDPDTGEVVGKPRRIGTGVSGVAVGRNWTWVTNPKRGLLLRLDPRSGRVLREVRVPGEPGPLALGGERVWLADLDGKGVSDVDAESGRLDRRGLPPQAPGLRLAWGADGLWVAIAGANVIRRVDPASLVAGEPIRVGGGPAGVTVGGGFVWVASSRSGTVSKVDPSLRAVVDSIEIDGHPGGIDAGTSAVWVADREDDVVRKIDLESGEVEGAPIQVGPEPGAVAVGGDAVWVANNGDGTVTRIEP
jgi:DNA-binding beta-propeller fold protein YncE/predicted Ser/Thr protein kinase